mmetsp:Transcript_17881/g.47213  ORF Transcript_17881/g.47213 Transcript_17881/m.47213 type:complete len:252 (+) Transcript_17881:1000-1755(+)
MQLLDCVSPDEGVALLHAPVGDLRRRERVLHDDADDHVDEAERRHHQEEDEKHPQEGLPVDDVPHHVVAPPVEGHDLEEGEHGPKHGAEVLLVGPHLAIVRGAYGVGVVVLPDLGGHHDGADVEHNDHDDADPPQRLERVDDASHQQPELAEDREHPDEADHFHDAQGPQHREETDLTAHACRRQDERLERGGSHKQAVQDVPEVGDEISTLGNEADDELTNEGDDEQDLQRPEVHSLVQRSAARDASVLL